MHGSNKSRGDFVNIKWEMKYSKKKTSGCVCTDQYDLIITTSREINPEVLTVNHYVQIYNNVQTLRVFIFVMNQ